MAAVREMVELHGASLFRLAMSQAGQACDAWDLVQDTFERALRSLPPRGDQKALRGWLFKVLRNRYMDHRRSATVKYRADIDIDLLPQAEPEEVGAWRRSDLNGVRELLPALSPPLREVFRLHIEGVSGAEIARQLTIPVNTVASRVFRAKEKLRRTAMLTIAEARQD